MTVNQESKKTEKRQKKDKIISSAFDVDSEISKIDLRFKANETTDKQNVPPRSDRKPKKESGHKKHKSPLHPILNVSQSNSRLYRMLQPSSTMYKKTKTPEFHLNHLKKQKVNNSTTINSHTQSQLRIAKQDSKATTKENKIINEINENIENGSS